MSNWSHHLLLAMPRLQDPVFVESVVYLLEHGEHGAFGLVINKQLDLSEAELLEKVDLTSERVDLKERPVLFGGPVAREQGFILHDLGPEYENTFNNGMLALTSSKDILEAIADGGGPDNYLIALGSAGWSEGQLENEIKDNAWIVMPAEFDLIFATPSYQRYGAALRHFGIEPADLLLPPGHA